MSGAESRLASGVRPESKPCKRPICRCLVRQAHHERILADDEWDFCSLRVTLRLLISRVTLERSEESLRPRGRDTSLRSGMTCCSARRSAL